MKSIAKTKLNRRRGAALVEGVIALAMIIMGTVGAVLLLVNTGMSMYYKQKLGFIASEAAMYAAVLSQTDDVEVKGSETARALLQAMGFNPSRCDVKVSVTTVDDKPAIKVTITTDLKMFGKGDILPGSINIQDTAVALRGTTPDTLIWFRRNPQVSGYLLPVIRIPPDGPGSLGLPVIAK
jgi:Flp pilus assembly protein TadG